MPLGDLTKIPHDNPFQKLRLEDEYNLPNVDPAAYSTTVPITKRWLISAVSSLETTYALGNYLGRRIRRTFGLPEVLPRDKSHQS